MKVIFLDIDGVLNNEEFDSMYNKIYSNSSNVLRVDPSKVEVLADICHEVDASVVITSSWKLGLAYYRKCYGTTPWYIDKLLDLFNKYDINILGFTPNIPNEKKHQDMWKEYDINAYLREHPEVDEYCIIDDEDYDLQSLKDRLVKTNWKGNGGVCISDKALIKRLLKS